MTGDELVQILANGESSIVEFKRCGDLPHADTFETVCSFANRLGGDIYLGVDDDGSIIGIDGRRAVEIERNVANVVSTRKLFSPAPMVETERIQCGGRTVVRVWVAPSSSVIRFKGVVYDRVVDADIRIESDIQISQMYIRKQNYYSERRIFRYVTPFDLRADLIARMRDMAVVQRAGHPWGTMSNDELFRSAKLYDRDYTTGEEGFNLAAVLLLGKDEVISSICPAYVTDAIVRREAMDRYDDRLSVRTNLFDAYEQLSGFVRGHLPDRFVMEGDKRTSPRDVIARELVANSLMHREYSSPVVARIIMDNESIRTINASRSFFERSMQLGEFIPMPKNPIIADVFVQTGMAEKLGSGLRALVKASRLYTELEPEFSDGDIFNAKIPMKSAEGPETSAQSHVTEPADASRQTEMINDSTMMDPIGLAALRRLDAAGMVTVPQLVEDTGADSRTIRKRLNAMVADGRLLVQGKTKNRRYLRA